MPNQPNYGFLAGIAGMVLGVGLIVGAQAYRIGEQNGIQVGTRKGRIAGIYDVRLIADMAYLRCLTDNCKQEREFSTQVRAMTDERLKQLEAAAPVPK